jgi:uncharacterized membrane protein
MTTAYNELSGRDLERLKTLADGVFAVAMTLLVLDLRLPGGGGSNGDLWSALGDLGPQLAAYALSFTMLGTFWLAEHTLLRQCDDSDRPLVWGCLAFLFFVTTLPFTASVLADHTDLALAVGLYWLNLAMLGACLGWQLVHAVRAGLDHERAAFVLVRRRLVLAQALYAVSALLALASPQLAIGALALTQLFFVVSPRLPWRV